MGLGSSKTRASTAVPSSSSMKQSSGSPARKYTCIGDDFRSLDQVTNALREAGLESSNLIVGVDFTKSNEWTGKRSFRGKSLHSTSSTNPNPYEQAIEIVGKTLSPFDEDNLIPCFGFGDASTHDQSVFSFNSNSQPCAGFEKVLSCYKEIVQHVRLAGPTSFAPIIRVAMDIVEESGGQYHVLLLIADGQVTQSLEPWKLSPQEKETIDAIVEASKYALSIVLVGVGDGPWETMKRFDDSIPRRAFDNFQFVNFTQIMSRNLPQEQKEASFALAALMEIPTQYKATRELKILNRTTGKKQARHVLPPPRGVPPTNNIHTSHISLVDFSASMAYHGDSSSETEARSHTHACSEAQLCPICLTEAKDMAFGCGHQTCKHCAENIAVCPICRQAITTRLRLYS